MTIIITGISGFVGRHFLQYCYDNDIYLSVIGVDAREPLYDYSVYSPKIKIVFRQVDLLEYDSFKMVFEDYEADYVLHLASFSSVAYSWSNPTKSFMNNTNIFLNLINAIRETNNKCRILSVGSSEEYGRILKEDVPIKERLRLNPVSPYAVARVSQEMMSKIYVESYGMDIVLTRSFNHIGPWQDERFAIPSFIRRILNIKKTGAKEGVIQTGDTAIIRDFVDVRDVVRAYWMLLREGKTGEVYNVCSGNGVTLKAVIDSIADIVGIKILTEICDEYVRPNDNPIIVGENYKISSELGWAPSIGLRETLTDTIHAMEV